MLSAEPSEGDAEIISAKGDCDDIGDDLERQDDAWNGGRYTIVEDDRRRRVARRHRDIFTRYKQ